VITMSAIARRAILSGSRSAPRLRRQFSTSVATTHGRQVVSTCCRGTVNMVTRRIAGSVAFMSAGYAIARMYLEPRVTREV
jgi:hypothetical protein